MKYFTEDELKCSHCGESRMNESFMNKIEALREHPIEARKSSPGAHSTGHAIDIGVRGEKAYMLLDAAVQAGLTGIGINQKGSSGRFIHLDDIEGSRTQPRPTIWSY